ncbi:MAG: hypothetical protein ACKON7_08630, partial [Planctomycetaceae bacterium]
MQESALAAAAGGIDARIAELESRLAAAAASTGDIDIRAAVTADGLAVQPWSCEMMIIGDEPIERQPSPAASLRLAGDAFEECGALLLSLPGDCLPACLAKPLEDHAN